MHGTQMHNPNPIFLNINILFLKKKNVKIVISFKREQKKYILMH